MKNNQSIKADVHELEEKLKTSYELFESAINSTMDRFHVLEAVRNEAGEIVDFRWLLMNTAAKEKFGDHINELLVQNYPGVIEEGIFDIFKKVTETGISHQYERHYRHEGIDAWVYQSVVKLNDGIVNMTKDITDCKMAEQEIKEKSNEIIRLKEEIVQKATNKYLSLFNSIDEGFCIMELEYDSNRNIKDLIFREQNPSFEGLTGLGNVVGKKVSELLPNFEALWIDVYKEVVKNGESIRCENYVQEIDRWYSTNHLKIDGKDSPFVAVVFDDITERKRIEASMKLFKEVSEDLLQIVNGNEMMLALCKKLGEYFGATVCAFSEVDEVNKTLSAPYIWHKDGNPGQSGVYKIDDYHSGEVQELMRSGKPEVVHDIANFPKTVAENMAALGIGAYVNLPFVRRGLWRATLTITDSKPRIWKEDEIELMEDLTFRIWTRLERIRAKDELRESEEKYRKLEERQSFLLKFNDALRPLSDPIQMQAVAADLLGEHLKANQTHYGETIGDYAYIDHSYGDGLPPMIGRFRHQDFGKRLIAGLRKGEVQVCKDITIDETISEAERRVLLEAHIGAYIAMPLIKEGEWVATLAVHSIKPREWKISEITLVQEIAERTWVAVEKARAELALQDSEKRLKELNENLEQLVEKRTNQITKLKIDQEKERLNAILLGQEQERTRIGEGLHNGVAQLLFAAQTNLRILAPQKEHEKSALTDAMTILSEATRDTRHISFELMPPVLKDFGLQEAIQTFMQRILTGRIQIDLNIKLRDRLSEQLEISLYRIVQEILSNIVKHSGASQARIHIYDSPKLIHLKAQDDGVGFEVKVKGTRKGIGLQSIKNRVKLLDGKIKMKSEQNKGTVIEIQLPIESLRGKNGISVSSN
ncbi:MAG TPA: GAF domain-containing protein [Bacteroidia bacterium]|jgi:signal transduction histidine kinase/PAS domain-containing protein|nr:GAF domain-containing protein [Bacteroidia bacterium]